MGILIKYLNVMISYCTWIRVAYFVVVLFYFFFFFFSFFFFSS